MSRLPYWFSILALALSGGCSDSDSPAGGTTTSDAPVTTSAPPGNDTETTTARSDDAATREIVEYIYRCTSGEEFAIAFGDQSAELYVNDVFHQLRQQPAGSGVRYTDEDVELITKGDRALVLIGDTTHDCQAIDVHEQNTSGNDMLPPPGTRELH